jgi:hypothetical protein
MSDTPLAAILPGSGIQDLKLTIVPDPVFKAASHDRHLRFEAVSVWVGRDLEIFGEVTLKQDTSCQYIAKNRTQKKEDALVQGAKTHNAAMRRSGLPEWPVESSIISAS